MRRSFLIQDLNFADLNAQLGRTQSGEADRLTDSSILDWERLTG
jgi:hypothetical protein